MSASRTAVVIEDDADIRGLIETVLGFAEVGVTTAATGAEGAKAVRAQSPAIVILDYGLPDINGLEVIGRIRSFSSVYILVLTGHKNLSDLLKTSGANAVMTKPFRPRELRAQVEAVLALQNQES
jgi:DNA-binding response OmpR family regulator